MISTMNQKVDVTFTCERNTISHHLSAALSRLSTLISTFGSPCFSYNLEKLVELCQLWYDHNQEEHDEVYTKLNWYARLSLQLVVSGNYCTLSATEILYHRDSDQFMRSGDRRETIYTWQYT